MLKELPIIIIITYSTGGAYNPTVEEPIYQRVDRDRVPNPHHGGNIDPRGRPTPLYQNPPIVDARGE